MKNALLALLRIVALVVVYFITNAIVGVLLPLSNAMVAALPADEQASFMPLFLLNTLINMIVLLVVLTRLRYKGWKLFLAATITFFGLFGVLNGIELIWYNEAFPLLTYLDVIKMMITNLLSYGAAALAGTLLIKGFSKEEQTHNTRFDVGRWGWKIGLFVVLYPLFYYCCGFIPWSFPKVREFYATWALTTEPIPVLLLFNVFRGALWFLFSLPILLGVTTHKQALWLLPLVMMTGTAVACLTPNAMMPPIVRLGHSIELGFSMAVVGVFVAWLFLKEKQGQGTKIDR
jgi:hypothetical protein